MKGFISQMDRGYAESPTSRGPTSTGHICFIGPFNQSPRLTFQCRRLTRRIRGSLSSINGSDHLRNDDLLVKERMLSVVSSSVIGNFMNSPALLANTLQNSCLALRAVVLPTPNCRAVDRYVSPVANLHSATAIFLSTDKALRMLVSSFAKSRPTIRTIY